MAYPIETIEGIGPAFAEKLAAVDIKNTEQLLEAAKTKRGRVKLAADTEISEKLILKWVNHADLMRIKGVGGEFAELLEAAGVDTIKELRHRKPENLVAKMTEVNADKKLTRRVPTVKAVEDWVEEAKTLEPTITH